ncbi:MAG TPA: chloride channel protein, partial [Candidatus Eisenbacteria bacterium]|nr:chloride channel protein [Candidatus Eisenbacteria bacterium]
LAVELLLFEWKPRSLIPVALASATAAALRPAIIGFGPVFSVPRHALVFGTEVFAGCIVAGLLAGLFSAVLTRAVYAAEDAFYSLPIHWMWWPAIGAVGVGIGGLVYPQALGVGYETIEALLQGDSSPETFAGVLVVKALIWVVSLGSGTSGGVLAPLLMMGAALGGLEAFFLPGEGAGFWPLVSMGAILGGVMRSPLTAVVFSLELTHDLELLLPLLVATVFAYGFTALTMRRSILTEKVSRRGFHLSREYAVDPLEVLFVREVMRTKVVALPKGLRLKDLMDGIAGDGYRNQRLFPVLDERNWFCGVATYNDLQNWIAGAQGNGADRTLADVVRSDPVVAFADEPLRIVVYRMAETGFTRLPVLEKHNSRKLAGMVSLTDLLRARARHLEEEQRRERVLRVRFAFSRSQGRRGERDAT